MPDARDNSLTPDERARLARLEKRLAASADSIEQAIDLVDRLADSGVLAGMNAGLDEFDDNFSAMTRPDVMTMVANMMMLLGLLSQLPYEGGFRLAMEGPAAIQEAYPRFRERQDPMHVREAIDILRSPDVAAALELMVTVLRSQRGA